MNVILLTILCAVLILDKYAFAEFGFSQPIVAGTIIGAVFGDITTGIFLGALLQLIFLGGIPIGKNIPPDGQGGGIVGCASYFLLSGSNSSGHSLFLAVILALGAGVLGGIIEISIRRYNERLYQLFIRDKEHLAVYHLAGLLTAFVRGVVLFAPLFFLASILHLPQYFPQITKETLIIIGMSVGLANGIYLFVFIRKTNFVYLIFGGLCGLALLVL